MNLLSGGQTVIAGEDVGLGERIVQDAVRDGTQGCVWMRRRERGPGGQQGLARPLAHPPLPTLSLLWL